MIDRRSLLARSAVFAAAGLGSRSAMAAPIKPGASAALIVVDVQNCFLPGGSLAVKDGDKVVPVINKLAKSFANIVCTQDWHTAGHVSFASSHPGKKPFDVIKLGRQFVHDFCASPDGMAVLHRMDRARERAGVPIWLPELGLAEVGE